MSKDNRRLNWKRSSTEVEESGFTLIELLIVIVVLGILAAIVVFALQGVTGQSTTAACQSDAKTVGIGVAALQAENPTQWQPLTGWAGAGTTPTGTWYSNLIGTTMTGAPFLQSWPQGNQNSYKVTVFGASANPALNTGQTWDGNIGGQNAAPVTPATGDVLIIAVQNKGAAGTGPTQVYDATQFPVEACMHLAPGT